MAALDSPLESRRFTWPSSGFDGSIISIPHAGSGRPSAGANGSAARHLIRTCSNGWAIGCWTSATGASSTSAVVIQFVRCFIGISTINRSWSNLSAICNSVGAAQKLPVGVLQQVLAVKRYRWFPTWLLFFLITPRLGRLYQLRRDPKPIMEIWMISVISTVERIEC